MLLIFFFQVLTAIGRSGQQTPNYVFGFAHTRDNCECFCETKGKGH